LLIKNYHLYFQHNLFLSFTIFKGKYIWADKDRYEGEFKDDKCEGQGEK